MYRIHRALPGRSWRSGLLWRAGDLAGRWRDRLAEEGWYPGGGPAVAAIGDALRGRRIAILVASGFGEAELTAPRRALARAGAHTEVVAPESGGVRGRRRGAWSEVLPVGAPLAAADPAGYDGLLLPGGGPSVATLRRDARAVEFVRAFVRGDKPVAAICHGPGLLIEAGGLTGRTVTSSSALRDQLEAAGARWVDRAVVVDGGLVTSRRPYDLPAFTRALLEAFAGRGGRRPGP